MKFLLSLTVFFTVAFAVNPPSIHAQEIDLVAAKAHQDSRLAALQHEVAALDELHARALFRSLRCVVTVSGYTADEDMSEAEMQRRMEEAMSAT